MHRGEDDFLIFRSDNGDVFAGHRIGERDLFEERVHILVAKRVLRQLFEIVQPRLRIGELRSRVVGISLLHDQADALGRILLHRLGGDRTEDAGETLERRRHASRR